MYGIFLLMAMASGTAQPTPDELGMLDSATGFATVCGELKNRIADIEKRDANNTDEDAVIAVAYMNCISLVRGVVETVNNAATYQLRNGPRLCPAHTLKLEEVLDVAVTLGKTDKFLRETPGVTAALVVLTALAQISQCPESGESR